MTDNLQFQMRVAEGWLHFTEQARFEKITVEQLVRRHFTQCLTEPNVCHDCNKPLNAESHVFDTGDGDKDPSCVRCGVKTMGSVRLDESTCVQELKALTDPITASVLFFSGIDTDPNHPLFDVRDCLEEMLLGSIPDLAEE